MKPIEIHYTLCLRKNVKLDCDERAVAPVRFLLGPSAYDGVIMMAVIIHPKPTSLSSQCLPVIFTPSDQQLAPVYYT